MVENCIQLQKHYAGPGTLQRLEKPMKPIILACQLNISTYTRRLKLLLIQLRLPNGKELDCRAGTLFIKVLKNCLLRK